MRSKSCGDFEKLAIFKLKDEAVFAKVEEKTDICVCFCRERYIPER